MNIPQTVEAETVHRSGKLSKTLAYYASFIALGLAAAMLGPSLPFLATQTGTQLSEISFLFISRALGYLVGSLQSGRLFDRLPGNPIMAAVVTGMALTMALIPAVPALWLLTGVLFLLGLAEGAVDIGGNILLIWVHRSRVGPYMNGLHFFFGLGAFLAPIFLAQAILQDGSIRWGFWGMALLMVPVAFWLLRLPSPRNQVPVEGESRARGDRLFVALIAVFFLLYVGAEVSFGGWVFSYTRAMGLAEGAAATAQAAYLTSAFWLSLTAGRLLAIPIASRFSPGKILLADLLGCLASLALILWGPNTLAVVWTGAIGCGLFMASIFPTTLTLAEQQLAITGGMTRWFFVGAGAGGMTLPWLIGQLFESAGPRVTMFGILANLLLALLIYLALDLLSKRRAMVWNKP
jgi:MFS transporter, FHS family, Na+ dependent glucose transporter 1